jgi:hypothetical protein
MEKNIEEEFTSKFGNCSSEQIVAKIQKGELVDILGGVCYIKEQTIVLDYMYFKYFATKDTYNMILNSIIHKIDTVLSSKITFVVYVNLKKLTILDLDKHIQFIKHLSEVLKERYPDRLEKCYIYNVPFVFAQIFNILSTFINKDTLEKIVLVGPK